MNMAEELIEMLKAMTTMDYGSLPNVKFIGLFRKELLAQGFEVGPAEAIASSIDIELPVGSVTNEHIEQMAEQMAILVRNLREELYAQGFMNPTPALLKMADKLTLKIKE